MFLLTSAKGGVGTSVVAAGLALTAARRGRPTLLVDLAGDLTSVLGVGGLGDEARRWLIGGDPVTVDAVGRVAHAVADPRLDLLSVGDEPLPVSEVAPERWAAVAALLAADHRLVVVDGGPAPHDALLAVGSVAIVTRQCFLATHRNRASRLIDRASGAIVVTERSRALGVQDVASALGLPVLATVPHDEAVASSVDAGLLSTRLPRSLERALAPLC